MAKFKETMNKIGENISQYWANSRFLNNSVNIKNKYMVLTVTGIVTAGILGGMYLADRFYAGVKKENKILMTQNQHYKAVISTYKTTLDKDIDYSNQAVKAMENAKNDMEKALAEKEKTKTLLDKLE